MKLFLLLLAAWVIVTSVVVWLISFFIRAREERRLQEQRVRQAQTADAEPQEAESQEQDKRIA